MKIVLDTHVHTVDSTDSKCTMSEYVQMAKKKNLSLIAITEHSGPVYNPKNLSYFNNLYSMERIIDGVEVLNGIELNILNRNGDVDVPNEIIKRLEVVIASFHFNYLEHEMTFDDNTSAVIGIIKNPYIKILGHLGEPRFPFDIDKVVKCAKKYNTFLEINNKSLLPNSIRSGGDDVIEKIIVKCKEINHPVVIASDSHKAEHLGQFSYALALLEKVKMPKNLVLNTDVKFFKKSLGLEV